MSHFEAGDVVQFLEEHAWCGCLGIVDRAGDTYVQVAVPIPNKGTAYIRTDPNDLGLIGQAILTEDAEEDDD